VADTISILSRWEQFYLKLLNVIVLALKVVKYKLCNQSKLIQAGGDKLLAEIIHKFILLIWSKKELI
jgi:hypothetical protein